MGTMTAKSAVGRLPCSDPPSRARARRGAIGDRRWTASPTRRQPSLVSSPNRDPWQTRARVFQSELCAHEVGLIKKNESSSHRPAATRGVPASRPPPTSPPKQSSKAILRCLIHHQPSRPSVAARHSRLSAHPLHAPVPLRYSLFFTAFFNASAGRARGARSCLVQRESIFQYLFLFYCDGVAYVPLPWQSRRAIRCRCSCADFCAKRSAAGSSLALSSAGLSCRKTIILSTMRTLPLPRPAIDSRSQRSRRFSQTKSSTIF